MIAPIHSDAMGGRGGVILKVSIWFAPSNEAWPVEACSMLLLGLPHTHHFYSALLPEPTSLAIPKPVKQLCLQDLVLVGGATAMWKSCVALAGSHCPVYGSHSSPRMLTLHTGAGKISALSSGIAGRDGSCDCASRLAYELAMASDAHTTMHAWAMSKILTAT